MENKVRDDFEKILKKLIRQRVVTVEVGKHSFYKLVSKV